jgi:hypothetical protein
MKDILLFFIIFLCNISSIFADKPTLYVEILKSDKVVNIQSHLLWNVDENTKIPKSFIVGSDKQIIKKYRLGRNRLKIKLFFPKQENGRRLNATTTVHLTVYMNGKEMINTKHFGQHSQEYVKHPDSTLCRPDIISLILLHKKRKMIQVKVQGVYTPKKTHLNAQLSHFNISTPTYSLLYSLMGLAAVLVTLYTAYIGLLFFTQSFPDLPKYYVWSIRLGILIFVIFSFEGGLMGSRMNHSVGAINDNSNWWIVGWSKTVGDLRVSHFIGMHALQLLPLLSFYIFKNLKMTIVISIFYGLLATSTLVQALNGKPLITQNKLKKSE